MEKIILKDIHYYFHEKNNINNNCLSKTMEKTAELEQLKTRVEKLEKDQQIEILRILNEDQKVKLNENKSGVYVNLSFLPEDTMVKIKNYLNYISEQEKILLMTENKKENYAKTYFDDEDENVTISTAP